MSDPLAWLLVIELIGLLAFPLAFFLFAKLPDRGYSLAKVLGLLLAAYLLWIVGLTGVAPNSAPTIAAILLVGAIVFGWLYYRRWPELEEFVKSQWRYVLIIEGLFLAVFLVWAFVISEAPGINHTEKPMDLAFLTSILQSSSFPPEDPWLSGHSISYYYFGHFTMALPMKLAGIASNVGYNLALASIPSLLAVGSFGLTYNLIRLTGGSFRAATLFGLAAPFLIILAGNLEGGLEFVQVRGWGGEGFWQWVGIKGLDGSPGSGLFPDSNWWWWRATRVIDTLIGGTSLDYTITEFPFFSFLLGDLHSHVLNLPFLVMVLALALNLFVTNEPVDHRWLAKHPWQSASISLSLGALAFVNSWDFPVYAAIFGGVAFVKAYSYEVPKGYAGECSSIEGDMRSLGRPLLSTGLFLFPVLAASVFLFLPFYLTFSNQASGILPYVGSGTRPLHFLLVMGLPSLLGLGLLWRLLYSQPRPVLREAPAIVLILVIALVPLLAWLVLAATWGTLTQGVDSLAATLGIRTLTVVPGLAVAGLAGYVAISLAGRAAGKDRKENEALAFLVLLLAAATYLLSGAELFHLSDFFGNRMNTVFKVYYQAWLLLGIAGAYGLYYCYSRFSPLSVRGKFVQLAWACAAAMLLVVALYYPVGATLDRTGLFGPNHDFKENSLDGLAYIRASHPAEYTAIQWLRDEAEQGRIVEAVGDDYSEYGRVSAATGRPTVLGWKGHEHQWRGTAELFLGREQDVARIYQNPDPLIVVRLLAYYDVRYVYLGHRERAKYGVSEPASVDGVFETVYERDDVVIYESLSYSPLR